MEREEKALLLLSRARLWGDYGEAGTCTTEVKMAAGGGTGPKRPVSLAREKGWLGGPTQKMQKFSKLIGHSERVLGPSHTQTNKPRETKKLLSCSSFTAQDLHWEGVLAEPLHEPRDLSTDSFQEGVTPSC